MSFDTDISARERLRCYEHTETHPRKRAGHSSVLTRRLARPVEVVLESRGRGYLPARDNTYSGTVVVSRGKLIYERLPNASIIRIIEFLIIENSIKIIEGIVISIVSAIEIAIEIVVSLVLPLLIEPSRAEGSEKRKGRSTTVVCIASG